MLKKRTGLWFMVLVVCVDIAGSALGLATTYWLRFVVEIMPVTKGYAPYEYLRIFPFVVLVWIISLNFVHLYMPRKRVFGFNVIWRIVKGSFLAIFIIVGMNFLLREAEYSRPVVVMAPFIVSVYLCIFRFILEKILVRLGLQKGVGMTPVFIVGTGTVARTLARRIREHPEYGYRMDGFLTENPQDVGQEIAEGRMPESCRSATFQVVGVVKDVTRIAAQRGVKEVILARPDLKTNHLLDLMLECEKELITVHIVPDLLEIITSDISVNEVGGVPLFGLKETPLRGLNLLIKRLLDLIFAGITLLISSPFMLVIAILIKLDSKGPVIYRQERMGADGHLFTLYKFRSMVKDAERHGPVWATENDPRRTRIGAFLRSWNLDELPQLVNVVKGDMSIVGPRPERPIFVEKFKNGVPRYMARHRVKSGITGWAQVNGLRGDSSIEERVKYDLFYIENWSFLFDIKILILTLFAIH